MNKLLLLFLLLLLIGCDQFETKRISSEEILMQETKELNWYEVDQYPAFLECRELTAEEEARECFETKVAEFVYARLEQKQPVVTQSLHDTLFLHLIISEKGYPSIDSIEMDSLVSHHLPKLKEWIQESVDSLPNISPATKRGIPVVTKFKMPIVIQAE